MMTWKKRVMACVLSAAMLIGSTPVNAFSMDVLSESSEEVLVLNEGAEDDILAIGDNEAEEVLALKEGTGNDEMEDDLIIEDLIEDEDPWMGEGVPGDLIDQVETETETESESQMTEAETEEELLIFEEVVEEAGQELAAQVGVNGEVYDMWLDSDTATDQLLPGSSLNLNAGLRMDCYSEENGYSEGDTSDAWIEWSCLEGEDVVTLTLSEENSFCATITANADMGGREALIRATAYVPDEEAEDEKREVASREFRVYVNDGYYQVEHVDIDAVPVGASVTIPAELTWYDLDKNSGETVADAKFRWEWNSEAILITDQDGNEVDPEEYYGAQAFTLKKLKNWNENVKLVAEVNMAGEEEEARWEYAAERNWNLSEYNYDIWFEDLGDGDHERIYDGQELDLCLNVENLEGLTADTNYTLEWQVGIWDETLNEGNGDIVTENSENYYTVSTEEVGVITLHGSAIPENGVSVRAIVSAGGEEVRRADTWVEKWEDCYDYDYPGQEPGDNELLPGQGFWIPREMDCYVENAEFPYGGNTAAVVNTVSVQYQRWQDSENEGEEGSFVDADHNGGLHIDENDDGWNIWCDTHGRLLITLTHSLKDYPDITGSLENMEIYVNGDTWRLDQHYPNNTDNMAINGTMEIGTSMYHSWNHGEDNHGEEEVQDYRLELQTDDDGNLCYDTGAAEVSVEYAEDGKPYLKVIAKEEERHFNIPVVLYVREHEDNGEPKVDEETGEPVYQNVGVRNFWVNICGEYHYIDPTELPNVKMGEELDLSAQDFSLWRHTAPADPVMEDENLVRYSLVGFDENAWEVKEGTEDDMLPVLIRKGEWDTEVTLMAEVNYKEDEEEEDDWQEVLRYNFHFASLDLELRPHVRFGELGGDGRIFTDYGQAIELETWNLDEALGDYQIEWSVEQYDEAADSMIPAENVEYRIENGGSVLWLTALEGHEYEWVEVYVSVQKDGIEYAGEGFSFRINEPEMDMDLPQGEFWRLVGWSHNFDKYSWAYVTNSFHPYGEDMELTITNMELEVIEGAPVAIELNQWEDENGWTLHVNNWGRAAVHADYLLSDGTKGSHEFDVCVGGELYNLELSSEKGTDHILPGASAVLTAEVWGEGYDYERGEHYESDLTGLEVEWRCVEGEDIIASCNVDDNDFRTFHLMVSEEAEEDREICIQARAYLPNDETGEMEEVAGNDFRFHVRGGYYQLAGFTTEPVTDDNGAPVLDENGEQTVTYHYEPLELDTWLEAGEQEEVMPALWYFENGKEEPEMVNDAKNYRWEWDSNALQITDDNGEVLDHDSEDGSGTYGAAPFLLERTEVWGTDVNLIAELPNENGDYEEVGRCSWHLDEINYDVWFENQRDGSLFHDEEAFTVKLNTDNIEPLGYEIVWTVGQVDENNNFVEEKVIAGTTGEGEEAVTNYTIDNNEVTFNGPAMKEALEALAGNPENTDEVDYGFVLRGEVYTDGHGTEEPVEVKDLWMHIHFDEEYLEDDEHDAMVLGERFYYTGGEAYYWHRNAEHPLGEEYTVTIRDIQVKDPDAEAEDTAYVTEQAEDGSWYLNAVREGEANIVYTLYHEELGEFTVERTKHVTGSLYRLGVDTDTKRNVLMAGQSLQILEYVEKAIAQVETDENTGESVIGDIIYEAVDRYDGEKEVYSVSYHDYNTDLLSIDGNGMVTVHENVDWWDNTDVRVEVTIPMENDEAVVLNQNINISIEPDYKVVTADPIAVVPGTTLHVDEIGTVLIHYNMEQPEGVALEDVEFFFEYEGMEDWLAGSEDGKELTISEEVEIEEGKNRYTELQLRAVYVTPQGYEEQWNDRWELTVCCPPDFENVTEELEIPSAGEFKDTAVWSSEQEGISNGTREDYYKLTVTEGQEGYYIFRRDQGSMLQIWTEDGNIFYNPQQSWERTELVGFLEAGNYYVRLVSDVEVSVGETSSLTLRLEHLEYLQFTETVEGVRTTGQICSYLVELPYDGRYCFLLDSQEAEQSLFLYAESLETGAVYTDVEYTGDISDTFAAGTYLVQVGDSGDGTVSDATSFTLRVRKDLIGTRISLSQDGFIYDGTEKKPVVTVTGEDGTTLEAGTDYVVRYCRENAETEEWEETTDLTSVGTIAVQIAEVTDTDAASAYVGDPGTANMQLYDILPQESVTEITELPAPGEAVDVEVWNTSATENLQVGRREDVYKISVTEESYYIFRRDQETVMQILDGDGNVYYNSNAESRYTDIVKFNAPSDSDAAMYYIRLISDVWFPNEGEEEPITLNLKIENPNDFQPGKTETREREVHQLDNYLVTLPYDGNYAFVLKHGTAVQNLVLYVEGMDVEFVDYTYGGDLSGEFAAGTYLIQIGDIGDGTFSSVSRYTLGVKKDLLDTEITLSTDSFTYNGAEQYPEVTVTSTKETDESGTPVVLTEGLDYAVEYLRNGEPTEDFTSVGAITVQIHDNGKADSAYLGWPGTTNEVSYRIICGTHVAKAGSDRELKAATCTETGIMQHVCDNCEESFTSEIPKKAHTPGAWIITEASTCTSKGTKVQKCTANGCGTVLATETIAKKSHTAGAWTVTKAATCTSSGTKVQKCTANCGTVLATQTIAATGHKGGTATCKTLAKCSVCGSSYGTLAAHKSNNTWKVVKNPTVHVTGIQTQNCSVCGTVTKTQTIAKLKGTLELPGNLKALSIKKGKTVKFKLTMTAGDTLSSCVSSNSKILKVVSSNKNGTVSLKAMKKGSANLTIKLASGTSKTYKVSVVTGTVKTTKIAASWTKLTLEKGKAQNLTATLTPFTSTQKVAYKTSDKKVAKVSASGKVTAVAPGTAKITLKSGSKSAACTVTVPGIANVKTSLTLKRNKSTTLKPRLYGITGKVTYTSSNSQIAKVDAKGKITAFKKKGTVTITVKAGKYSVKCKVKVK